MLEEQLTLKLQGGKPAEAPGQPAEAPLSRSEATDAGPSKGEALSEQPLEGAEDDSISKAIRAQQPVDEMSQEDRTAVEQEQAALARRMAGLQIKLEDGIRRAAAISARNA